MTIAFFSNILNIHQIAVADRMYELCRHKYWFVSFGETTEETLKGGTEETGDRPYHIRANTGEALERAKEIALTADILIYGLAPDDLIHQRVKLHKITILYSERWLKRGLVNIMSPILLKRFISYHQTRDKSKLFCLCASGYAKDDFKRLGMYRDKCFKWGYFITMPMTSMDVRDSRSNASTVKILWVARFLQLKHPERMLQLCAYLIDNGYENFEITMIGTGPEFEKINHEINERNLYPKIKLLGSLPNDKVRSHMQTHDIFCFTSDRNEGWGVVINEAMSCGCCVVANDEIGSVPYLIKDGKNGLIYHKGNSDQFCEKVRYLIDNPDKRKRLGVEAMKDIQTLWSPDNAAQQLLRLCSALHNNEIPDISEGPCSKA